MARTAGSHSEITGPKVRETAIRLIAQQGFAAVSMRRIAQDVGVQAGALYNYTPDKQSLLFDIMREHMNDVLEGWEHAPRGEDPLADLQSFTRFHIRFHAERPDEVFIAYMELRNLTSENFVVIEDLRRRYEAALEQILREGVQAGVFRLADPKIAAMAVIAMLTGVNTWFRQEGRLSLDEVEAIYLDMVRRMVGA